MAEVKKTEMMKVEEACKRIEEARERVEYKIINKERECIKEACKRIEEIRLYEKERRKCKKRSTFI